MKIIKPGNKIIHAGEVLTMVKVKEYSSRHHLLSAVCSDRFGITQPYSFVKSKTKSSEVWSNGYHSKAKAGGF